MQKQLFIFSLLFIFTFNLIPSQVSASASTNLSARETTDLLNTNVILPQSSDTYISWKLASNSFKTRDVYCSKGTTISISVVLSSTSGKARIGVIDPDDTYHVTSITGNGTYTYKVPSSGTYQIYCKNTSSATYTASISYSK